MYKYYVLLILLFQTIALTSADTPKPIPVSLLQLIATPERFDGKAVLVYGFIELSTESSTLFFRSDDYQHDLTLDALSLERNELLQREKSQINRKYVKLSGTFRAQHPNGLTGGRVTDITNCLLWSDPDHPRIERYNEIIKQQHSDH